jgi:hypothetical protein
MVYMTGHLLPNQILVMEFSNTGVTQLKCNKVK